MSDQPVPSTTFALPRQPAGRSWPTVTWATDQQLTGDAERVADLIELAFDPSQRYVLYCEWGLKSAHLADLMRRAGLAARHVSGGVRELRRIVAAHGG